MGWFLRAVVLVFGVGTALPATAACPPGFPISSSCTNIENYTYSVPQAIAPYSSGLRILAAPNPADNSALYIPANLLATLNDTQTLTKKTLTNPTINGGTLNGTFLGNPIFAGIPNFTGLLSITCSSGLALDASGNLGKVACGGGGGGGFPITLGSTTISASSTTTAITGLTLSAGTLSGNTGGNPNFTGQPMFTGLPSGTCSVGLALDSGHHLVTTACGSGGSGVTGSFTVASSCTGTSCTPVTQCWALAAGLVSAITTGACGGGGGGHFFAVQGGAAFGVQGGAQFGVQ